MSEFGFVRADMSAAKGAADDAVALARSSDGADALATLAAALPGTQTAAYLPTLGELWRAGIHDWCGNAETFGESIEGTSQDGTATDAGVGNWLWPFGGR
jgi:hypothetical protein